MPNQEKQQKENAYTETELISLNRPKFHFIGRYWTTNQLKKLTVVEI